MMIISDEAEYGNSAQMHEILTNKTYKNNPANAMRMFFF